MKIYSKEQVKKAIEIAQEMDKVPYTDNDYTHRHNEQNIIQSLAPIELPSDEEIEKAANTQEHYEGAMWLKYKILNQNK